jgi:hypothetical protein
VARKLEDGTWEVDGRRVPWPVRIRDATIVCALYPVPRAAACTLVDGTGLRPLSIAGRSLLVLFFVQYRDGDLGVYDEVGLAFAVRSPGGIVGVYVHELPVTQAFTMEAGRAMWGLPKWLARAELSIDGGTATCVLADGDDPVLTATLRAGARRLPLRLGGTVTVLSPRGGELLVVPARGRVDGVRARLGGTTVSLGPDHRMAQELRLLGLPRRALATVVVDHAEFALPDPSPEPVSRSR